MNIDLGTYEFHDSRHDIQVAASIEPVSPAFREAIGRVYDGGRLRVRVVDPTPDSPNFDLLLESTSEDRWRLTTEVGAGLARILAGEHDRYIQRPFFMTYEHAQYGRLYFEPVSPVEREMGIAFSLSTRPHDPKTTQHLDIASEEDLEAFLITNRVNVGPRWMPLRDELSAAVLQGKADARAVISAQKEYEASVVWDLQSSRKPDGFDDSRATQRIEEFSRSFPDSQTMKALNEGKGWATAGEVALQEGHTEVGNLLIETGRQWANFLGEKSSASNANVDMWDHLAEEFESANLAAVRPDIHSFLEDSTEFYRWYEYGGKPRPEPLTREALADLLNETPNAGGMSQAFTAEQWDRFKDWKLGDLRSPIETLQGIVQEHGAERPWWESASNAADWCRTAKRPHPVEVHDALDGLIFRAQRDAEVNGAELPAWHQQATDARNVIKAAYTREIEASSSSTSLADAYGRLHELHAAHRNALLEGDAEQAAFERHEASQIERLFPVLKELVQFGADALEVEATDESPAP